MSQKKAKFNIVDIIVILVLIAGVAALGVRMFGGQDDPAPGTGDTFRVTFRADCIPQEIADTLERGCTAAETDGNMDLGKLIDFTVSDSVCYVPNSKGELVQTTKPGHVSVTLECEMSGIAYPTGILAGKDVLNVGRTVTVCFGLTEIQVLTLRIAG